MTDRYLEFLQSGFGRQLSRRLGLPAPPRLLRAQGGYVSEPLRGRRALLVGALGSECLLPTMAALHHMGALIETAPGFPGYAATLQAASGLAVELHAGLGEHDAPLHAIVFEAGAIEGVSGLRELFDLFQPRLGRLAPNGRIIVVGEQPAPDADVARYAAFGALRGFVRSLGKEVGRSGCTANLLEVGAGAAAAIEGALRFLMTEHAAFISGQCLPLSAPAQFVLPPAVLPLQGQKALVTGAARGIGAEIARTLAREGASVIGVDRPDDAERLQATMCAIHGESLGLDVTADDAGSRMLEAAGPLDIVVHNAGIARDRLLRKMPEESWDAVMAVNLEAILRINQQLLFSGMNPGARMVCVSSIGGIAGNPGQTNYAATKAAIIAVATALAAAFHARGGTINAVAPGFIETRMTASMPLVPREFGRRLNSLMQSGTPADVAEAVTFLATPWAAGINGQCLRVCGQHLMGV